MRIHHNNIKYSTQDFLSVTRGKIRDTARCSRLHDLEG